jgi:hypothetical protein
MLINFSNHPSLSWSKEQKEYAIQKFESICDIEFPAIDPYFSELEITDLVQKYVQQILQKKPVAVHVMGEMNFTYKCINILKNYGITCLASTSKRNTIVTDNQKTTIFEFVKFREY